MKIKAITTYEDTYENKFVEPGTIYDTNPERARVIVGRNLAVYVEHESPQKLEEKPKKVTKGKK